MDTIVGEDEKSKPVNAFSEPTTMIMMEEISNVPRGDIKEWRITIISTIDRVIISAAITSGAISSVILTPGIFAFLDHNITWNAVGFLPSTSIKHQTFIIILVHWSDL